MAKGRQTAERCPVHRASNELAAPHVESAVMAARGEVTIPDAAAIQTA